MSYKLFRLHWNITKNGVSSETYSYHKDDTAAGNFVREVITSQRKDQNNHMSPVGAGREISTHNGHLFGKVLASKKFGLWEDELEVQKNTGELALS